MVQQTDFYYELTLPAIKAHQQVSKEKLAVAVVSLGGKSRSKVSSADTFQQHSAFH